MDCISGLAPERREVRRRKYVRDFKLQAVQQMQHGLTPTQLSRELGIPSAMLSRWVREAQADPMHAFRGRGRRKPLQATLDQLQRENVRLRAEKDLLKKGIRSLCAQSNWAFEFIESHRDVWPIRWMCEILSVSPSGYYDWAKRHRDGIS